MVLEKLAAKLSSSSRTTASHRLGPLVALVSALVSLTAAELVYRWLHPEQQRYSVAPTSSQYDFYRFDAELGWSNLPGARGRQRREEFEYEIRVNQHGMRQREIALEKPAGVQRIAVLGDSFVWGIGVPDEERLTERLEELLPATEVLNFGVSGYGPVQYQLMLDRVAAFAPDVVVLVFCLSNDFADNVLWERYGYYKPWATLDADGALEIRGYPLPNVRNFAVGARRELLGSTLAGRVQTLVANALRAQDGLVGFRAELHYRAPAELTPAERTLAQRAVEINRALLASIAAELRRRGIPLLLVPAPTKAEYPVSAPPGSRHHLRADAILRETSAELGISHVDTVPHLELADFWELDGHWRPRGHAKIARLIADALPD